MRTELEYLSETDLNVMNPDQVLFVANGRTQMSNDRF